MRIALALSLLCGIVALASACKDGVTPDCTTDPTVCSPIYGDAAPTTAPETSDAASTPDAADATDAADDASG